MGAIFWKPRRAAGFWGAAGGLVGITAFYVLLFRHGLKDPEWAISGAAEPVTITAVDFTDGTTGTWTPSGGAALEVVPDPDDAGDNVLSITRSADYEGIQSPTGIFRAGATYDFSMRARIAPAAGDETPPSATDVRFVMKPDYTWIGNTTITSEWTTVAGSFTAPADADPAALQAYLGTADQDGPYTILIDDILVTSEDSPGPGTGTVLATDFEDGTLGGWGPRNGADDSGFDVAVTDTYAHESTYSAGITNREATGDGIGLDVTGTLQAGTVYDVSAWVRFAAGTTPGNIWLSLAHTSGGETTYDTLGQFSGMSSS
jgi:endo-1,4-beta-xylanase